MTKTFSIFKRAALLTTVAGCTLPATAQELDTTFHNYLYDSRTAYFNQLPVVKGATVFFGDSITHWGDWAEFLDFRKALNRGIAGDNTFGLLGRVEEVIRHRPKKIFILIGTNDINLNKEKALPYIVSNYKKLIDRIRKESPATEIYVQSIFPVNNVLINRTYYKGTNEIIGNANKLLKEMAEEMGVSYVEIYDQLLDDKEQLAAGYTYDGLHLSGAGYLAWVKVLKTKRLL